MEHPSITMWTAEDLDILASDLDSSLSGLGGNTNSTFDMSDALSAIQVIKFNKEEENLHRDQWLDRLTFPVDKGLNKEKAKSAQDLSNWNSPTSLTGGRPTIKKPCRNRQEDLHEGDSKNSHESFEESPGSEESRILQAPTLSSCLSKYSLQPGLSNPPMMASQFQYVLGAATALGSKIGEETLTYLNQGQAYEIRLKKLHGISEMRGKLLKSILRVGFQERRLQFREKLEIIAWQNQRPAERILDIDLSLSYGIFDVIPDAKNINSCQFMWDPTREASVFLKVNCISTEFTSKRRGGEKGVPFRILIETYSHWESPAHKLDAASCLVKVFKSKGADRKHKTDKEKLEKLPQVEQCELQPSYQYTLFTPCSITLENMPFQDLSENAPTSSNFDIKQEPIPISNTEVTTSTPSVSSSPQHIADVSEPFDCAYSPGVSEDSGAVACSLAHENYLTTHFSVSELQSWLTRKKFSKYIPCFSLYSAKDILCLSREDLVEICGAADGIRLYNSLHVREPRPLRRFYVSRDKITFHAVYLDSLKYSDLCEELGKVYKFPEDIISNMYVTGPEGILLVITDKVLQNLKDESTYICEILKAEENEKYTIILRTFLPKQEL